MLEEAAKSPEALQQLLPPLRGCAVLTSPAQDLHSQQMLRAFYFSSLGKDAEEALYSVSSRGKRKG